ncbi:MAG: hypothetical protein ACI9HK_005931 [Pirellulaceae bacterium]|jgi:hypothetical protein
MKLSRLCFLTFCCFTVVELDGRADDAKKPPPTYVELTGRATDVRVYEKSVTRPSYEDPNDKPFFVFELKDEADKVMPGKSTVIIGRHTTRYYGMKVSPTFSKIKPAWKNSRVRVIGRLGIDNPFAEKGGDAGHVTHFPEAGKLPADRTITAYIVEFETAPDVWTVWHYNNWFHGSEDEILNDTITRYYAQRKLDACTNEPLDVLLPLLTGSDREELKAAGFEAGLMFGRFGTEAKGTIRFAPTHYYLRDKKTTLAK